MWTLRTGGELNEFETKLSKGLHVGTHALYDQTTKRVIPDKTCVDSVNINKPDHVKAKSGRKVNYSCTLASYSQLGGSSDFSK